MRLYDYAPSLNGYKVRLLLSHLGLRLETEWVDIFAGEARTAAFLRMNPSGQVPVLEVRPGAFLPESNAILYYLAQGTPYWPSDALEQAQALRWMFFEQESHQPSIATLRHWTLTGKLSRHPGEVEPKRRLGHAVLAAMNGHLAGAGLLRGHGLFHRGHGPLRLHPPGARGGLRAGSLPSGAGLARPRAETAGLPGRGVPLPAECRGVLARRAGGGLTCTRTQEPKRW